MNRRLSFAALSACVLLAISAAYSQDAYPTRPVKIIVGFPAGTTTDILARIYGDKLSERLGQRFIIENMPGGASNTAAAAAARAEPDGYTLFVATNANSASVSLYKTLRYDFPGDFSPISLLASAPPILVVSPTLGVNTVKELIAYAKERPGEVMYGSAGVGTGPQLAAELFNMEAGVKLTHVPYKGTNEAVADLLTGRLSVLFAPYPSVAGFVKDGRLKALATTTEKRSSVAPELTTIAEAAIPGFDVTLWFGLVAPKGTPAPILKTLADAVEEAKKSDDLKRRLAASGGEPISAALDEFAAFIRADIPKWKKAIEHAGMKIE